MEAQRGQLTSAPGLPAAAALIQPGGLGLLGRRIRDLGKAPPLTCPPATAIAAAAVLMSERGAGSIVVLGADGAPLGIVTDRDLRSRVLARGMAPGAPVSEVMSSPLLSVSPDVVAFEALLEMTRRRIHHLGVVEAGRLVAVVSSHDMILVEGAHPLALVRAIERENSLEGLAVAASRVTDVVRWLTAGGIAASEVGRFVAELNDLLVARAAGLVEHALEAEGHGRPPVPYSWLAAGSEARREQTLKTDQDNGLVYADPSPESASTVEAYFGRFTARMTTALVRLGFPECPGGFMASNPRWCQPAAVWRERFASWMETPQPEPLLAASVFFDLRPVAGDPGPGCELWRWLCERAPTRILFLRHLAREAVQRPPGLGFFGRFKVESAGPHRGRLDLKRRAIFPITHGMRVCALSLGLEDTHTLDRLRGAAARGLIGAGEAEDLRGAYESVARLRLLHQLRCLDEGAQPDNFLDPGHLARTDRLLLKDAMATVAGFQEIVRDRFQVDTVV